MPMTKFNNFLNSLKILYHHRTAKIIKIEKIKILQQRNYCKNVDDISLFRNITKPGILIHYQYKHDTLYTFSRNNNINSLSILAEFFK